MIEKRERPAIALVMWWSSQCFPSLCGMDRFLHVLTNCFELDEGSKLVKM